MSRIGKRAIDIPEGVTIDVGEGVVTVKGPKGELSQAVSPAMRIDTLVYGPLTVDKALHVLAQRRAAAPGSGRARAGAASGGGA